MCLAIFVAIKRTKTEAKLNDKDSRNLPFTYFIIITCWIFLSGSWMIWNPEARQFMARKFTNLTKLWIDRWGDGKEANKSD